MDKIGIISCKWADAREQTWGEMVKICLSEDIPDGLEKTLTEWRREYPESSLPQLFTAIAEVARGDVETAEKTLEQYLAWDDSVYGRALKYYIDLRAKGSLSASEIPTSAQDSNIPPQKFYTALGEILFVADLLDDSVKFFRKSLVFDPDNARVWATLGHIFTKLKQYDNAHMAMQMAEKYAKNLSELIRGAVYYIVFGDYQRAIEIYHSVDIEHLTSPHHLINCGLVHFRMGDFENAEKYWRQAIRINEKNPFAHYNLACLYAARGEFDRAWDHYAVAASFSEIFIKDLEVDQDIQPLAKNPDYQDKIARLKEKLSG